MKTYHLYQTGILIASITFENQNIFIQQRDFLSGELGEKSFFDPIIHGEFLNRYTRFNITEFLTNFEQYNAFILAQGAKNSADIQTCFNGLSYQRKDEHCWAQRKTFNPVDLIEANHQLVGCISTNREFATILIEEGYEDVTVLKKWKEKNMLEETPSAVKFHGVCQVPMRDKVNLSTIVYLPEKNKQPCPIIFVRTPYGKESYCESHFRFVQRGFGVVIQDTRGRNDSEGNFSYNISEQDDGEDTLDWIHHQEWCDGNIGMFGASYGGYVQWSAAASGSPYLNAIVSTVTSGGPFTDVTRKGGTYSSGLAWWFAMSEKKFDRDLMNRNDWSELMKIRPINKIPEIGLGHRIPAFDELLSHQNYDDYFNKMDWVARKDKIRVPALIVSGWYDDNEAGSTEAIEVIQQYAPETSKIVLGPWLHNGNSRRDLGDLFVGLDAIRHDIDFLHLSWFNRFLKQIENGIEKTAPLEYYTIHENKWKEAEGWQPKKAQVQPFYLSAEASAKNCGKLMLQQPSSNSKLEYMSNPSEPVPHLINVSDNELSFPNDYAKIEQRADVIHFSTPVLNQNTTVTGVIKVKFYAKTDVVSTDWVVRVTDVAPNGSSYSVAMNVLNTQYRESWTEPTLLEPDKAYLYELTLSKTSYCFQKGHKIRLHITNSAENYIYTSGNTEKGVFSDEAIPATYQLLTGPDYPSVLELPIEKNN